MGTQEQWFHTAFRSLLHASHRARDASQQCFTYHTRNRSTYMASVQPLGTQSRREDRHVTGAAHRRGRDLQAEGTQLHNAIRRFGHAQDHLCHRRQGRKYFQGIQ